MGGILQSFQREVPFDDGRLRDLGRQFGFMDLRRRAVEDSNR